MFKVGDKVWSVSHGWGEVERVFNSGYYPVSVMFGGVEISYTSGGSEYKGRNRSLFFGEVEIPKSVLERPKWRADYHTDYYYITSAGQVCLTQEDSLSSDSGRWEAGNYFQTIEEAKKSKFYEVFHKEV